MTDLHSLSVLRRACAVLAAGAVAAGCVSVGPDFKAPAVAAPQDWSAQHGGAAELAAPANASATLPADRWAVFADPQLARLQSQALLANADAQTAALRVLQSRAQESTVSAQRGVSVNAQAGAARQRQSEFGAATRLVDAIGGANSAQLLKILSAPFNLYDAGFDASWEPDLWGRVLRMQEAARAGTVGQAAELRQVQLSVKAEVARAYFALRAAQSQLLLAQQELAAAQDLTDLLEAQVRFGLADASTLDRQRAQLAGLQASLPALRAQEAQSLNRLTLLCGAAPGSLNDALAAPAAATAAANLPDLRLGLPAELARRRPDVRAAEARLHAATASLGVAVADLYPRIRLGASFGLESVGSARFGEWGSRQWSVGPSLSIPLWDQGRRRATIQLRQLQQQEAAVAFQQTVLKAWHEVDDAISGYVAEVQRNASLTGRVSSTADAAMLAQASYASGLTSEAPVLNATAALLEARRELTDSDARVRTALAALYKSLGDDGSDSGTAGG